MTSEEYNAIKSKYDILSSASMKIGQAMYKQDGAENPSSGQSSENHDNEEKVVDAEYEDLDKK